MEKIYIRPNMRIHNIHIRTNMLDSSLGGIDKTDTEEDIGEGGNLTKRHDIWVN